MRALVLILVAVNFALAAYYLLADGTGPVPAHRAAPGDGTLRLVSEAAGGHSGEAADDTAVQADGRCWRRILVPQEGALAETLADLRAGGYRVVAVAKPGNGFTVRVAEVATIQAAAQRLDSLSRAGVTGLRVRSEGDRLVLVADRVETRAEAQALARRLQRKDIDARVMPYQGESGTARVIVSGGGDRPAPGQGWQPVNCQVEQR